jgi:uncharacterized OB-fold protein
MQISRHWRIRKQRYSMMGGVCPNCDAKLFPVRDVCPNCGHGSQAFLDLEQDNLYSQPVAVFNHVVSV